MRRDADLTRYFPDEINYKFDAEAKGTDQNGERYRVGLHDRTCLWSS